ncbi:MAG: di-heme oxidoredictase family protein [Sinimarinibacterium flocculans]|uniref:di-heme oxidoreductase family protein n=1 Tax=Sinimarinibacterium flocculans TaxID=985250 RepID=UPI003C4EB793
MRARPVLAVVLCYLAAFASPGRAEPLAHRDDLDAPTRERVAAVLRPPAGFTESERFENLPGGATTVRDKRVDADIFSHPSSNLDFEGRQRFQIGNGLFRKDWVSAPSSTQASDGLGPLFNARSCQGCHLKDGRGTVPDGDEPAVSLFLRLSVPPRSDDERAQLERGERAVIPEPTYGGQLQNFAVAGLPAEGRMTIRWRERRVELAGDEVVSLRVPEYGIADFGYGPPRDDLMVSPRLASPMPGLGLLAAIHEADILANADRGNDPDGVSGKPAWTRAPDGSRVLGRFGWKAGQPGIASQAAHAFAGDMGLSTPLLPDHHGDCTPAQPRCRELPHGANDGAEEVPAELLEFVAFYSSNLAVPARRDVDDPQVLAGKRIFHEARCNSCHVPKYVTRRDAAQPEHRFQLIWPYTDLLLHDMGEDLADHRPEGLADGREWRTPPLWGVGLAQTVNPRASFLHDGRARSLLEAILWHGGEAQAARDRVVRMTPQQRADLIRFLESL